MFKTISICAIATLMATTAQAGTPTPAPAAAPVYIEPAPAPTLDWTGAYFGAQVGYGDVGSDAAGVNGGDIIGGIIAGYDYDFGEWVAGAGIDYDFASIDLGGAAKLENVLRLKARAGRKIGNGLAYGTAGYARAYTDALGDDDGFFIGVGYEHRMSENFGVGAEILYHEFSDFNGSGTDVDATTFQIRATYRF